MASRTELFDAVGLIPKGPDLDSITEQAYLLEEEKDRQSRMEKAPGGRAFYASMFPGGKDQLRCARKALYEMMNIPSSEPVRPQGRAIMEMGKAAEKQIVWRWGRLGILLNVKVPDKEYGYMPQVALSDPDTWLSGYPDALLDLRPRWDSVLPVDVKSKSDEKINAMKKGELPPYEDDHYKQVQAYLYMCRKFHKEKGWEKLGLKQASQGVIYYVSRDNPRNTWTAHVPYDQDFVERGLERLLLWREYYLNNVLPERPKEWKWTKPPCQWCDFKKLCKQDIKDDVTRLSESNTVQYAKKVNPEYDEQMIREEVMKRWVKTKK